MKIPVIQLTQNLLNMALHLKRAEKILADDTKFVQRIRTECDFLQRQIDEAKKLGKTEFDPEKFLVKKK